MAVKLAERVMISRAGQFQKAPIPRVVTVEGNLVTAAVGSVEHPMVEEHFIQWVALETERGSQIKKLLPGEKPQVVFSLAEGEKPVAVYEYCNLHGLWKTEL